MLNGELDNLSEIELNELLGRTTGKIHQCLQTGIDITLSQKEIFSLMKSASNKLFPGKPTMDVDDFPDVLDGDKLPLPPPNAFPFMMQASDGGFDVRIKSVQKFVMIRSGLTTNHSKQIEQLADQLNEQLKTKEISWVGNIQFVGAQMVLPVLFDYYEDNKEILADSDSQTATDEPEN